jgi:hypothetical protein
VCVCVREYFSLHANVGLLTHIRTSLYTHKWCAEIKRERERARERERERERLGGGERERERERERGREGEGERGGGREREGEREERESYAEANRYASGSVALPAAHNALQSQCACKDIPAYLRTHTTLLIP